MDLDVIRSLKLYYCHSLSKRYITSIDGRRSPTNINMLEVMTLLTVAWECVSQETLMNCFNKADISSEGDNDPFKFLDGQLKDS